MYEQVEKPKGNTSSADMRKNRAIASSITQKQGRLKPTVQMKGKVNINEDVGLEQEANVMTKRVSGNSYDQTTNHTTKKQTTLSHNAPSQLFGIDISTGDVIPEGAREEQLMQQLDLARKDDEKKVENYLLSEIRGKLIISTPTGLETIHNAAHAPGEIAKVTNVDQHKLGSGIHGITSGTVATGTEIKVVRDAPIGLSALTLAHEYVHDSEIRAGSLIDPQQEGKLSPREKFNRAFDIAASEHFARESEIKIYKELKESGKITGEINEGHGERNRTTNFFRTISTQSEMNEDEFFRARFMSELFKNIGGVFQGVKSMDSIELVDKLKRLLELKRQLKQAHLKKAKLEVRSKLELDNSHIETLNQHVMSIKDLLWGNRDT